MQLRGVAACRGTNAARARGGLPPVVGADVAAVADLAGDPTLRAQLAAEWLVWTLKPLPER